LRAVPATRMLPSSRSTTRTATSNT
jgi:hypothetical protein